MAEEEAPSPLTDDRDGVLELLTPTVQTTATADRGKKTPLDIKRNACATKLVGNLFKIF